MITKTIFGRKVSVEWSEEENRYIVYVDGKFVGGAGTTDGATWIASDFIRKEDDRNRETLNVKLDEGAFAPIRSHPSDAGMDLSSRDEDLYIAPGQSYVFDTGVHVQLPLGTCGLIMSRSGLNIKHGIVAAGNGVIDQNFTGSIGVKIYNMSKKRSQVKKGDRIAQMLIIACQTPSFQIVEELEDTDRGENRYGSTGR